MDLPPNLPPNSTPILSSFSFLFAIQQKMNLCISAICRKDKINKQNEVPIIIKITSEGKIKRISLGHKIDARYWNFEKSELNDNTLDKEYIQHLIDTKIQEIKKRLLDYKLQGKKFTLNDLVESPEKQKEVRTVEYYFTKQIERLKKLEKYNTAQKYQFCLSALVKFRLMNHYVYFTAIEYDKTVRPYMWVYEGLADYFSKTTPTVLNESQQQQCYTYFLSGTFPDYQANYWGGESVYRYLEQDYGQEPLKSFVRYTYVSTVEEALLQATGKDVTVVEEGWKMSLGMTDGGVLFFPPVW